MRTRPVIIEMTANQCSINDVFQDKEHISNGNKSTIKSFFFVVRLFLNQFSSLIRLFPHLERKEGSNNANNCGAGGSVEFG